MLLRSIIVNGEECQIDYLSLANLPTLDGGGEGANLDLDVDYNVVEGSRNPVSGGAVYNEIQFVYDAMTGVSEEHARDIASLQTQINNKVSAEEGKGLSTNDFTDTYKNILDRSSPGLLKVPQTGDNGKIPYIHNGSWMYVTIDNLFESAESESF